MDSEDLPPEHDVIVLGTGMTESIVAAAMSRIGLRVLHLDRNDGYGGTWGSFNFSSLQQWIASCKEPNKSNSEGTMHAEMIAATASEASQKMINLSDDYTSITNVETSELVQDFASSSSVLIRNGAVAESTKQDDNMGSDAELQSRPLSSNVSDNSASSTASTGATDNVIPVSSEVSSKELSTDGEVKAVQLKQFCDVKKQWRKFAIDLVPKVLYSKGMLVELLISSDVAKYCEFRSVTRILTLQRGKLEQVPCSRADVFSSHDVSIIEKRLLMKLLTFCMEYQKHPNEYAGFQDKPFVEFLKAKKLTETIRHYVQHAIAMVTNSATTLEGLAATQKFLQSLGRYGNTAFLWPLYGSGELLQCFCRMCAVFGGVYCLRRTIKSLIVNADNKVTTVIASNGQRLTTKWLIMDVGYASPELLPNAVTQSRISRAVVITDRSIKPDKNAEHITVLSLPIANRSDSRVTVYELSSLSLACPDGFHVVHLTCLSGQVDAKTDLKPTVDSLFQSTDPEPATCDDNRPKILWSLYFNIEDASRRELTSSVDNVIIVGGPDGSLDCDHSIVQAKAVFEKVCPGEEFLPKAPNPEDIIYDDGENNQPKETGFEPIAEASSEAELAESEHIEANAKSLAEETLDADGKEKGN